jgi:hypothetical protein
LWLHSLKVAQLLRSAACLHTNQSRSYLNHLVYEDGMRKFPAFPYLKMHCSETIITIFFLLRQYRVWVRRTVWLLLTWANSSTPGEATHNTIMSTTNPTLHVLGSNMNLHIDKPATNCLPYDTAWSVLQCLIFERVNLSGTYSRRSDVKDKGTKSNEQTTWEKDSYKKWEVSVCVNS